MSKAGAQKSGLLFVSAEKSNAVFVLDPRTCKVAHTVKIAKRPHDRHFSAYRKRLYVACGDANVIDVIDTAMLQVVSQIKTGDNPELFAIDEKRRRVYVANEDDNEIGIVDLDKGTKVSAVMVPASGSRKSIKASPAPRSASRVAQSTRAS